MQCNIPLVTERLTQRTLAGEKPATYNHRHTEKLLSLLITVGSGHHLIQYMCLITTTFLLVLFYIKSIEFSSHQVALIVSQTWEM